MAETASAVARKVTKVAVLDSSVRLVVLQFMVANERVPQGFPSKPPAKNPPMTPVPGVEVLPSTKDVNLIPLLFRVDTGEDYELVDAWKQPHATNWKMSIMRFVYCRKQYVKRDELFPDFVAKRDELATEMANLVSDNLWTVQGYLNPYCEPDGSLTDTDVLMLGCVACKSTLQPMEIIGAGPGTPQFEMAPVTVFEGGRDPLTRQGIGRKVLLSNLASQLRLVDGEVQLELSARANESTKSASSKKSTSTPGSGKLAALAKL